VYESIPSSKSGFSWDFDSSLLVSDFDDVVVVDDDDDDDDDNVR
jgi:hypothetical protein